MYKIWGVATGQASHIEGCNTTASGSYSHSEGWLTESFGKASHAEGKGTYAYGENSHAEGESTIADGNASHAEGTNTKASQNQAHAEGWNTEASGYHSHSEGSETLASGNFSHAGGKGTIAAGEAQTAIGRYNEENSDALFVVGNGEDNENRRSAFVVNKDGSIVSGQGNIINNGKVFEILDMYTEAVSMHGDYNLYIKISNTDGIEVGDIFCLALETNNSTIQGLIVNEIYTYSSYSLITYYYSDSNYYNIFMSYQKGIIWFPEKPELGNIELNTEAQFVVGKYNKPINNALFIVGNGEDNENRKNAFVVNADGSIGGKAGESLTGQKTGNGGEIFNDYENNKALSEYSSVSGSGNAAGGRGFNILDLVDAGEDENGVMTYALLISDFSNIESGDIFSLYSFKLKNNFDFIGKVEYMVDIGGTDDGSENMRMIVTGIPDGLYPLDDTTTEYIWFPEKPDLNGDVILGTAAHSEGYNTKAIMIGSHAEGGDTIAAGKYAHAEGRKTKAGYGAHSEGYMTEAIGVGAHSEGYSTMAIGEASHVEGHQTQTTGTRAHAEGWKSVASGQAAHAEGCGTTASGLYSHAEGNYTTASGKASHAEGGNTQALGVNSHAEGTGTIAASDNCHAEGSGTISRGNTTHASGWKTIADGFAQTVVGRANKIDSKALFIVGNGENADSETDSRRKNAFVVNKDGSATIQASGTNDLNVVNYKQLKDYTTNHRNIFSGAELPESATGYTEGDIFIVFEE
jgi:autotransporter adhesin